MIVADVISRAMRMMGSLESGRQPTADEAIDGLFALNTVKRNLFGSLIGQRLSPQPTGLSSQQAEAGGEYQIPAATFTLTLPANPRSGSRVGVVDANRAFALNNCTIARNGRLLEGAASNLTLTNSGDNRRWWFRGDTGNWVRQADYLTAQDVIDFPDDLAEFLPYLLAVAWASEFDSTLRPDIIAGAQRGEQAFARQYARRGGNQLDGPVTLQPQQAPQR